MNCDFKKGVWGLTLSHNVDLYKLDWIKCGMYLETKYISQTSLKINNFTL